MTMSTRRLFSPKYCVGHWPLRNHALDKSGYGNDGSVTNMTYTDGPFGKSVGSFDGTGDYVTVASNAQADTMTSEWTVAAWFKSADTSGQQVGIVSRDDGVNRNWFMVINTSGQLLIDHHVSGVEKFQTCTTLGAIDDGAWHFVAMVNDGTDIWGYIDTKREIGSGKGGTTDTDVANLRIGTWRPSANEDFDGQIANVRIYSVALTGDELAELMRSER